MVGANLGLGTDDDGVEILQGGAQLIRLIELLNDLVTHLTELRHGGLIHAVGNQNTHSFDLLIEIFLLGNTDCHTGDIGHRFAMTCCEKCGA